MNKLKKRYSLLLAFVFITAFILLFRAYELAYHSPVPLSMLPNKPLIKRGTIYDSDNQELAISRGTVSIGIQPDGIVNPEKTAFILSKWFDMDYTEVHEKLIKAQKYFYLKTNVPLSEVRDLQKLRLSGVVFEEKISRFYPNDRLASSVLGFTDVDGVGLAGIEYEYNDTLITASQNEYVGNNVHLTINSYIQHELEKFLEEGRVKSSSKAALGLIMDVHTGNVLAMASLPDFNPNYPTRFSGDAKRNRVITENIAPGSTFKIFIFAALMKDHMLNDDRKFYCPGYFKYKGKLLHCSSVHGEQTLLEAIKNSCNTAVIEASWSMPIKRLYEHFKQFGFSKATHIDLPGEEKGIVIPPEKWNIELKMTIPIGQGISVTPVQLVTAANSIANGGMLIEPRVVDKVTSPNGKVIDSLGPRSHYMVVSPQISRKLMSYLQHVVMPGGTGYLASIPNVILAGKTGTTEKYTKGKYQASFIGFYPGDNPEISIYIWYDEPQGPIHQGGQVAAPIFKRVLEAIIPMVHKGKIRETVPLKKHFVPSKSYNKKYMPNFSGKSKKEVLYTIWSLYPGDHNISGQGYLIYQNPPPGTPVRPPYHFTLKFSGIP